MSVTSCKERIFNEQTSLSHPHPYHCSAQQAVMSKAECTDFYSVELVLRCRLPLQLPAQRSRVPGSDRH